MWLLQATRITYWARPIYVCAISPGSYTGIGVPCAHQPEAMALPERWQYAYPTASELKVETDIWMEQQPLWTYSTNVHVLAVANKALYQGKIIIE